jgi:tetratricopeptide (TPR) repeat protein
MMRIRLFSTVFALGLLGACAIPPAQRANEPEPPIDLGPASVSGNYLAALHAQRLRDSGAAAEYSARVLEANPMNVEVLLRTHVAMVEAGRIADALPLAGRIAQISTGQVAAQMTLVVDEIARGQFAAAERRMAAMPLQGYSRVVNPLLIAWINVGLDRNPAAFDILRSLLDVQGFKQIHDYYAGLIAERSGRFADAETYYRAALEGEDGAPPRLVELAGGFLERRGRIAEARQLYLRYRQVAPDSPVVLAGLARTRVGAPAGTAPEFPLTDARKGAADALFNLAGLFRQDATMTTALAFGQLGLYLDSTSPFGLMTVGEILDVMGQRDESDKLFARVPADSIYDYVARLRRAENQQERGDLNGALATLEALAREQPDRIEALSTMGNFLRGAERFPESAAAYGRALERLGANPERRHWSIFYVRGVAFERAKNWPEAERHFKRALELFPEQPDVLNYLAYTWVDRGENLVEAERMLRRAVEQRPNSGHIVDSLGWAFYRLGRYEEAVPLLERAAELLPEDPVLLDHLGDGYWRVGRRREAEFQWERALRSKPEPELKVEIEKKLRSGLAAPQAPKR